MTQLASRKRFPHIYLWIRRAPIVNHSGKNVVGGDACAYSGCLESRFSCLRKM